MATQAAIINTIAMISAAFPMTANDAPQIVAARAKMMIEISEGIADDFWTMAVKQLIADSNTGFAPSIGQIRSKALDLIARTKPESETIDASSAWQQLRRYLISDGIHGGPMWRDGHDNPANVHPLTKTAAARFGERRFVQRQADDEGTDFAQFRGIFEALQKRDNETANMLPAVRDVIKALGSGLADTSRQLPPPPKAIGIEPVNYYRRDPNAPPSNPKLVERVNAFKAKLEARRANEEVTS